MKIAMQKSTHTLLTTFILLMVSASLFAQVYKSVDEDGNVVYSDQAPHEGATPIKLREISIIEAPYYPKAAKDVDELTDEDAEKELSIRQLRRSFRDFTITSPTQEESIWGTGTDVNVSWNTKNQLLPGMEVSIFVDGKLAGKTRDGVIPLDRLDRGEHKVTAEIIDSRDRKIATAGPTTFFIKRTVANLRPRPSPSGGGG